MNKEHRRKALKTLTIATPVAWVEPVVDSVVLPAHGSGSVNCNEGLNPCCPSEEQFLDCLGDLDCLATRYCIGVEETEADCSVVRCQSFPI